MGGKRKRSANVASPNQLQPERTTDFLWGLAILAPEYPLVGSEHGPLGSAASADEPDTRAHGLPPIAEPPPSAPASEAAPKVVKRKPPRHWPGLAEEEPRAGSRSEEAPEPHRAVAENPRERLEDLLDRRNDPIADEAAWWARHGQLMRRDPAAPRRPASRSEIAPAPESAPPTSSGRAAAQLVIADARREEGDLEGAAHAIASALSTELAVPGGLERHDSLAPVIDRARMLVSPFERERRDAGNKAELEELERFEQRWHVGERLAAVLALRAFIRAGASGKCVERLFAAEPALALGRRERIYLGGEELRVVFGPAAWLGRSDADIDVRSPLVSRQHLLFVASDAGPVARDHASRNGTFHGDAGPRFDQPIDESMRLLLGREVVVDVERFGESGHLVVRTPGATTLLVLGERLELDGVSISRWQQGDLTGWRLDAAPGAAALNGASWCGGELARGDCVRLAGVALEL